MSIRIGRSARAAFLGCIAMMAVTLVPTGAGAHTGHPQVTTTSCSDSGCGSAVFAICEPDPGQVCAGPLSDGERMGPRKVTVNLHGFSGNTNVSLWWLRTEVANEAGTDCRQAVTNARTPLVDVTTDANGDATVTNVNLPPGEQGDEWEYGPNWVCATTAPDTGGSGEIADRLFTVYPA